MESTVTVSLGATLNLGNFESVRFDYAMTDKVRNYEDHEAAFKRVEAEVEKQLQRRIQEERDE